MTLQRAVPAGSGRLRSYVLWSFFLLFAASPLFSAIVLVIVDADISISWWGRAHMILISAEALLAIIYGRRLLSYALDGTPLPRWVLPTIVTLGGASALAGGLVKQIVSDRENVFLSTLPVLLPLLLLLWTLALVTSARMNYIIAGAVVGIVLIHQGASTFPLVVTEPQYWGARMISTAIATTFAVALSVWSCQWTLSVTRAVDAHAKVDAVKADLAAAEERLRIARDLHDVFGRTLTAVAVKSELAAALAEAEGAERAAEESRRVRALADDALREVRSVLAEYRRPELSTELSGAHSLLTAAGVQVRIIGEDGALPPQVAEGLALVVRETATNIVRHSEATRATFRLSYEEAGVTLTVTNNGARPMATHHEETPGSGLESLAARLSSMGGALTWERKDDTFTVVAHMEGAQDMPSGTRGGMRSGTHSGMRSGTPERRTQT